MNTPTTDSERVTAPAASFATVADRQAQGIDARERLPLSSVGDLDQEADRDPIAVAIAAYLGDTDEFDKGIMRIASG